MIVIKRVYEPYSKEDGFRILVDRLWPRGLSKEKAKVDLWLKEVAPSDSLRKWFGHDPKKWEEFNRKYKEGLKEKSEEITQIKNAAKKFPKVTLVYGANDTEHNQAVVLWESLGV